MLNPRCSISSRFSRSFFDFRAFAALRRLTSPPTASATPLPRLLTPVRGTVLLKCARTALPSRSEFPLSPAHEEQLRHPLQLRSRSTSSMPTMLTTRSNRPSDQRRSNRGIHRIGAGANLRARNSMAHAVSAGITGNYATSGGPTYCISYRANTSASIFGPFGTAT